MARAVTIVAAGIVAQVVLPAMLDLMITPGVAGAAFWAGRQAKA